MSEMMKLPVLDAYFAYCRFQKNLDPKTLKAYKIDLTQFLEWSQSRIEVSRTEMEQYIEMLVQRYKITTVKRKVAAIKAFYRYLVYEEQMQHSPFEKIQLRFRQELLLPRTIDPGTLSQIFAAAYQAREYATTTTGKKIATRDVAVLELLFASGVRVSELCTITCDTLDLHTRVVLIHGKGNKERQIYLASPQVLAALTTYSKDRKLLESEEPFFFLNRDGRRLSEQSVRRIINKYSRLAEQSGHYTPHMFRHSFATYLWDQCGDVYEVKEILGHSSIKTTERYVHASFERQKRLLSAKHPRKFLKI